MKPAKRLLLVSEDEEQISPLRYLLRINAWRSNHACYCVTTADKAEEALGLLKKHQYDLMLCLYPVASMDTLLEQTKVIDDHLKIIVMADKASQLQTVYADAILFNPSSAALLEHIKVLLYRKRGPMRGMKRTVKSETVPLVVEVAA